MQPGDQAAIVFVVAVFVIFSAIMAYATWLGGAENKTTDTGKKKR
jgi:hypothetical protein